MITVWTEWAGWVNVTELCVCVCVCITVTVCDIKAGSRFLNLSFSPIKQG